MFSRSESFGVLRNAMQAYAWRIKALTNNIANVETPGYRRMSVSFEENLQRAEYLNGSNAELDEVSPQHRIEDAPPSLEEELLEMTETQMRNHLASRALHEHFNMARIAITGRTA